MKKRHARLTLGNQLTIFIAQESIELSSSEHNSLWKGIRKSSARDIRSRSVKEQFLSNKIW